MRRLGALLAVLVVNGCAPPGPPGGAADPGGADGDVVSEGLAASMEVEVRPARVRLALHVTNTGTRPLELTFPTSQRYDFAVRRRGGEELWRWSEGMAFLQALSQATLGPGETWDMEAVWEPGSVRGELEATGWMTARRLAARQSTRFELP